jgi:hypothetical protein
MPAFLDAGDRRFVVGAVAIMFALFGLAYVLRPAPQQRQFGTPSSYSADWMGTKAAFLLLQQSGYRAERWESPPTELPSQPVGTTLIFAEPSDRGSPADRAAVSQFVFAGGRLLVMGASGAAFAPQSSTIPIPTSDLTPVPYEAVLPSLLSRNAPEITMIAPDDWKTRAPAQLAIYEGNGKLGVVWYRYGKGEVIWWAIASPASNGSIRDKGNLALLLNSVGPAGTRVLWDEYFHGARRSLTSYFAQTPLPWAGLQVAIAFVALLFTFSRRSEPAWMPLIESRTSPTEFVSALGELYHSAHAAPAAVEIAYHRLRLTLTRKLGMPAKTKLPELCRAAYARFGLPEEELYHTCSQAERAMRQINPDEAEALDLVRTLHDFSNRLENWKRPAQENPAWK